VGHHVVGELVRVERASRDGEVVHGLLGREAEAQRDVTELQVEVDDEHALAGERERDREVARRERLSRPALRAEHADEATLTVSRVRMTCPRSTRDRLAHREAELLLRLREERHVGGADLERTPEEPVRRRGREHDDRELGRRAVRAVDDLDRAVVLPPLTCDEEHVHVGALKRSDCLVDAVGQPDELERRIVGQGPLHVERVKPLDCDDCADRAFHGGPTAFR
jgi:hypothetical protein